MSKRPDLRRYREKRDFSVTPEPPPGPARPAPQAPLTFMVHKHDARRLHYDLRLEMNGALASWAIPKGPCYDPKVRRLAVETEDHPLEYGAFEGRIPEGEYGAGDSIIWDQGAYETVPPGQGDAMRNKGHLEIRLAGQKLRGRWHLVRTRGGPRDRGAKPQWIFFKARDEHASESYDVVADRPESVVSGRRVTRGPTPAALRQGPGDPVGVLLKIWPPLKPRPSRRKTFPESLFVNEPYGDGPRVLAGLSRGRVALQSEEGRDLAAAHPPLVRALAKLSVVEAAVEGEIDPRKNAAPAFIGHDILWLDGEDLRDRPLEERRELLAQLFAGAPHPLSVSPQRIEGGPSRVLAKKRGSAYVSGESGDWAWVAPPASRRRKKRPARQP